MEAAVREIIFRKRDVGMRRQAQADGGVQNNYCSFFIATLDT